MTTMAPDVGALVEYGQNGLRTGPGEYRVTGWLCTAEKPVYDSSDLVDQMMEEILAEEEAERHPHDPRRRNLRFCLRAEATHVALYGICGAIAPIEEVKVTGTVEWSQEDIAAARERAIQHGRAKALLL